MGDNWGAVKTNKGEKAVEVAVPTAETDINAAYEAVIHVLSTNPPKEEKKMGRSNCPRGLLLQLPDEVRNFSPSFSLLLIIPFFCVMC